MREVKSKKICTREALDAPRMEGDNGGMGGKGLEEGEA